MSNHFYLYGAAGFTSMEAKEYNFGSVKPGMLHPKNNSETENWPLFS